MESGHYKLLRNARIDAGARVLVRVDFNVPVHDGAVRGTFRIERALETVNFLRSRGAKVILISHIESVNTLLPVSSFLQGLIPHMFIPDFRSAEGRAVLEGMREGDVALLENVRSDPGEKENSETFSRDLARCADIFVNDAFSASHREHSSIVGVPRFLPGFLGFLFEEETRELGEAFHPVRPFLFILGGAKFDTKLPLVTKFQSIADTIIIGGALANDIYRARGFSIGNSFFSGDIDLSSVIADEKVVVPDEVVIERGGEQAIVSVGDVRDGDVIVDASRAWVLGLKKRMEGARTVLWNGPLGKYESGGKGGSIQLARLIAESSAHSIVGGGDTLSIVEEIGAMESFGFVSTGGGAMLDFLAKGTLPGIEALTSHRTH
jgi:phosphoglycerate kinase